MPADQRHLRDDTLHTAIDGTHHQYVAAAVAGAPDTDPLAVGIWQHLGIGDRVTVISDLLPRIDLLAWFAVAGAEVSIVEYERGETCLGKRLGEVIEIHLFHSRESMGHNDRRPLAGLIVRQIVPATQDDTILCLELDVLAHGFVSPSR